MPRHCTTVADTLTALWLAQPRWVPSVLTALQATAPTHLAEALAALGPRATAAVLDAILEEHLPELAGPLSPGAPPTVPTPRAQQDKANPPPAWLPLPITEVLLTTATTLAEHPAMARTPEFSRWLLEARVQPVEAPATLFERCRRASRRSGCRGTSPPHLQVVGESGASLPLPKEDPASDVPLAKNAVAPLRSRQRRTAPPAPEPAPQPAWQHRSWDGSGPAMKTDLATLLYAVNLVNWFDLSRISETTTGWAVVEAVGRWLLRDVPTGRRRTLLADPLLTLFAELTPARRRYATLSGWVPRSGRYAGSSPPTTSRSAHSPNPARPSSRAPTSTSSSASTRSISAPAPAVSTRTPAGCPSWAESCCSTSRAPPDDVRRTGASTGPGEDAAPARDRVERDGRPDLARRLPGRARGVPASRATAQQAADWWAATAQEPGDRGALGLLPLSSVLLLVAAGLIESDVRFGSLFAALQEPMRARRPCIGLLGWLLAAPDITAADLTAQCHDLIRHGLLSVENPTDPRSEWVLRVPVPVWDLLATGTLDPGSLPSQLRLRPREEFPSLDDLALSADVTGLVARLPHLVTEDLTAIVVRGMSRSGRTTVLGSVAALAGDDVLVYDGDTADPAWQLFGALASIADVLPVVVCEPGPGDTVKLPALPGLHGPLGIVAGRAGGVSGPMLDHALVVRLGNCGPDDRRLLWRAGGIESDTPDLDLVVERFLLTPGNIRRAAPLASLGARADGRDRVTDRRRTGRHPDVAAAGAGDPRDGTWIRLPVEASPILTSSASLELDTLIRRCRHRERLVEETSGSHAGLNRGVRALFSGPSGTGKTLAARYLAAVLNLDLYRVDLAAVVNKYIGETEKNLDQVLARAEELDVILLLDEGDALMTRRTEVRTPTTATPTWRPTSCCSGWRPSTASSSSPPTRRSRIDPAFQRRIDVTVDFVAARRRAALADLARAPARATHAVDPSCCRRSPGAAL